MLKTTKFLFIMEAIALVAPDTLSFSAKQKTVVASFFQQRVSQQSGQMAVISTRSFFQLMALILKFTLLVKTISMRKLANVHLLTAKFKEIKIMAKKFDTL